MNRVTLDPLFYPDEEIRNQVKQEMWELFAIRFSRAYYIPAYCSKDMAINTVSQITDFPPGVYSMDDTVLALAYTLGYYPGVLGWDDEYQEGETIALYDNAPILRITMLYTGQQRPSMPTFMLSFYTFYMDEDTIGVAFMGEVVLGRSRTYLDWWSGTTTVNAHIARYSIGFVYAPLDIEYQFDGLYVYYSVDEVSINGQDYWRIIPLFYYAPFYVLLYDYDNMNNIHGDYANPSELIDELNSVFQDLTWLVDDYPSSYEDWVTIYQSTVNPGSSNYKIDSNGLAQTVAVDLGWLITFLANLAVSSATSGLSSELHSLSTLLGSFLEVTVANLDSNVVIIDLLMDRSSNMPVVDVTVDKLTPMQEYLSDYYSQISAYPLIFT